MIWSEPSDSHSTTLSGKAWTRNSWGDVVYSKVGKFVVVKARDHNCIAVAITTYNNVGTAKRGIKKCDHAIIHTGKDAPKPTAAEQPIHGDRGMQLHPIRVDADERDTKLDPMSRVDFGGPHTIRHTFKVKSFGKVHRDSMVHLETQFWAVHRPDLILKGCEHQSAMPLKLSTSKAALELKTQNAYNVLIAQGWPDDQAMEVLRGGSQGERRPNGKA